MFSAGVSAAPFGPAGGDGPTILAEAFQASGDYEPPVQAQGKGECYEALATIISG